MIKEEYILESNIELRHSQELFLITSSNVLMYGSDLRLHFLRRYLRNASKYSQNHQEGGRWVDSIEHILCNNSVGPYSDDSAAKYVPTQYNKLLVAFFCFN